jgi:hypothetical protein
MRNVESRHSLQDDDIAHNVLYCQKELLNKEKILTARGASSPAKPALHIPEPLSITSYMK